MAQEYTFECEDCKKIFVVEMTPKTYNSNIRCEGCGSKSVFRDFAADNIVTVDSEPKTIGMLADKQAAKNAKNGTNNPDNYRSVSDAIGDL